MLIEAYSLFDIRLMQLPPIPLLFENCRFYKLSIPLLCYDTIPPYDSNELLLDMTESWIMSTVISISLSIFKK